jgi:hypothetical protein
MGKARKAVSLIVGAVQCGLGGLASAFAFLIYVSSSLRDTLAITFEDVYLYMFLLMVFGIFSILSGLLLAYGERSRN